MTTPFQQLKEKVLQDPEVKAFYDADTLTAEDVKVAEVEIERD